MRKPDSVFNEFCKFINNKPIGTVYRTCEMIKTVASHEKWTSWKSSNGNTTSARYQTMLKYAGIIKHKKRGYWKIDMHIPDWFDSSHLYAAAGHDLVYEYSTKTTKLRCGMTRDQVLAKLSGPVVEKPNTNRLDDVTAAMQVAFNSTYGAFVCTPAEQLSAGTHMHTNPATVTKVEAEQSTFYKTPDAPKYGQQLQENLMLNAGYINSALAILDQADFIDPVQHARVINIMAQLKDLQRTIDERMNKTNQNI